jgi:hypothetical protein
MASHEKRSRAHLSVTAYPAIDRARSDEAEDDPYMVDSGRCIELPYYVELAGEYSIPGAITDDWDGDEAHDDSPWDVDVQPLRSVRRRDFR